MSDLAPGHGGNAGLCLEDHTCPNCEAGQPCVDLFEHPICGLVACDGKEAETTDTVGPDSGFASMCTRCGRGLVSVGEWCFGGFTPVEGPR